MLLTVSNMAASMGASRPRRSAAEKARQLFQSGFDVSESEPEDSEGSEFDESEQDSEDEGQERNDNVGPGGDATSTR